MLLLLDRPCASSNWFNRASSVSFSWAKYWTRSWSTWNCCLNSSHFSFCDSTIRIVERTSAAPFHFNRCTKQKSLEFMTYDPANVNVCSQWYPLTFNLFLLLYCYVSFWNKQQPFVSFVALRKGRYHLLFGLVNNSYDLQGKIRIIADDRLLLDGIIFRILYTTTLWGLKIVIGPSDFTLFTNISSVPFSSPIFLNTNIAAQRKKDEKSTLFSYFLSVADGTEFEKKYVDKKTLVYIDVCRRTKGICAHIFGTIKAV